MNLQEITESLLAGLEPLRFSSPVAHVYNPLIYARQPWDQYLEAYGQPPKELIFCGMNPGPWGMAQTGVPFGEVAHVRDWLGIEAPVNKPASEHPRVPIAGFDCHRSEVSGRRVWGWAKERFGTPGAFFSKIFVLNYCPLVFLEEGGKNRTPDKLPKKERLPLEKACDAALRETVLFLGAHTFICIGRFVEQCAERALADLDIRIARITHPSPANPAANRGWVEHITREFEAQEISL